MGLVEQFTKFFQRQEPTETKTTSDEVERRRERHPHTDFTERFRVEGDRRSLLELSRRMYEQDPRIDGAITTMARDATKGGFSVVVSDGPGAERAVEVANDLMRRLKLATRVDDWVRLALRDGDDFLELGVDGQRLIQEITRKPTLEMHRHTDKFDRWLDGPARAFWWSEELMGYALEAGPDAIWFPAWMVVHARWRHDGDSRYGKPLFSSSSKSYRRVEEGELDVAVRRKVRAPMRYVHVLEGADETAIEEYQRRNEPALDGQAAVADFFTNVKGGIEVLQGDANLSQIDDVMHHIETMFIASPVPLTLLGYGSNLNRDILEQKQEQYERALESVSGWVVDQLVEPLITRQWLLSGIWPDGLEYEITQAYRQPVTPTEVVAVAEALIKLRGTGLIQDEMLIEIGAGMLPAIDAQRAKEELAQAMESQPDEVDRMGAIVGAKSGTNDDEQNP